MIFFIIVISKIFEICDVILFFFNKCLNVVRVLIRLDLMFFFEIEKLLKFVDFVL